MQVSGALPDTFRDQAEVIATGRLVYHDGWMIDGTAVSSVDALQTVLSSHQPGQTLTVHVVHRGGTSKDYAVKLGAQPQQGTAAITGCPGNTP